MIIPSYLLVMFILVSQILCAPPELIPSKIRYTGCDLVGAMDDPPPPVYTRSDISEPKSEISERRPIPIRRCTKTLIVVILDESGSMEVQKADVIGGYNSFLANQREIANDQARLILIKFNTVVNVAHGAMELSEVPRLTTGTYRPGGGTALYDAVAEGIRIAEGAARTDERVLVLIMTDGEENSSRKSTSSAVKAMIQTKEALGTWTFAYIGQNPEGWAKRMVQSRYNVQVYDMQNQGSNMEKASDAVSKFRGAMAPQSKAFFQ